MTNWTMIGRDGKDVRSLQLDADNLQDAHALALEYARHLSTGRVKIAARVWKQGSIKVVSPSGTTHLVRKGQGSHLRLV